MMYNLVLFYVLTGQFHTDVSSLSAQFKTEALCKSGANITIETLKRAHSEVSKIEWSCMVAGN